MRVEHGVVTLAGVVRDLADLHRLPRLARRLAGRGRVVKRIDFLPPSNDAD